MLLEETLTHLDSADGVGRDIKEGTTLSFELSAYIVPANQTAHYLYTSNTGPTSTPSMIPEPLEMRSWKTSAKNWTHGWNWASKS
jgi:hypothetical protein